MTFKFGRVFAALAMATALLVPAGASAQSGKLEKFTLMFPVKSVIQYHPAYFAKQLGYFEQEGLDVQFESAPGSSAAIQQLIAGNADIAIPSPGAYLNAVAQGHDLRWIFSYEFANVFTMVVPEDSPVKTVADLKGKKLGISELSGGEVPLVRAVLRKAGLEEGKDVQLVAVGEGSALTVQAMQSGQVHAYSSSVFDVATIQAAGIKVRVILPKDAQEYPSNGLVVTAKMLQDKPKQVAGFARAFAKGIVYAKANDERAFNMAAKIAPEEFEDKNIAKHQWDAIQMLTKRPPSLADKPLGTHYTQGFQNYHSFLRVGKEEEGALPKDVDLKKALDPSVLDDANKFDADAIKKQK